MPVNFRSARATRTALCLTALSFLAPLSLSPALAASDEATAKAAAATTTSTSATAKPPTLEEIKEVRRHAREEVMLPSLEGIRGFAYGVVGVKNRETFEKDMAAKFSELGLPMFKFSELTDGSKPVDAMVEVKIKKAGGSNVVVDFQVTQWVSLLRAPKKQVRAVTYHNQQVAPRTKCGTTVSTLSQQFVVDFLKANKKESKGSAKSK